MWFCELKKTCAVYATGYDVINLIALGGGLNILKTYFDENSGMTYEECQELWVTRYGSQPGVTISFIYIYTDHMKNNKWDVVLSEDGEELLSAHSNGSEYITSDLLLHHTTQAILHLQKILSTLQRGRRRRSPGGMVEQALSCNKQRDFSRPHFECTFDVKKCRAEIDKLKKKQVTAATPPPTDMKTPHRPPLTDSQRKAPLTDSQIRVLMELEEQEEAYECSYLEVMNKTSERLGQTSERLGQTSERLGEITKLTEKRSAKRDARRSVLRRQLVFDDTYTNGSAMTHVALGGNHVTQTPARQRAVDEKKEAINGAGSDEEDDENSILGASVSGDKTEGDGDSVVGSMLADGSKSIVAGLGAERHSSLVKPYDRSVRFILRSYIRAIPR